MRFSTAEGRDDELAGETITAAVAAGVTVFDTARAYGLDEHELGHNERLLAGALRRCRGEGAARIVTKGGMTRAGGGWIPDGRARAIQADCEASLAALDGLEIDLYLIHAPDPAREWRTSVRALARVVEAGLARRVGVSNVNRQQLDQAVELAPISAVEVALNVHDDHALRSGMVDRCADLGIALVAHSPLGGPRRAGGLERLGPLLEVARERGATPAEIALAWLLELSPDVVAIPGATRPETARSAARAAAIVLAERDRMVLDRAYGRFRPARAHPRPSDPATTSADDAEVVLIMGIPAAGKTRIALQYVARGYIRLNRDERGGGLRELADAVDHELSVGARRIVLDNTYLTRAARSYVLEAASRHRVPTRCIWLDTPLAQAQVNLVERLLDGFGALPTPAEVRRLSRRQAGVMAPTSQMRAARELEPPSIDEGFVDLERVPFVRTRRSAADRGGVYLAAAALRQPGWEQALAGTDRAAPHLIFDWRPEATAEALDDCLARVADAVTGPVQTALCPHPGGPPICWCRPPLPGLALAFAQAHELDPARGTVVGTGPAHRTLAGALAARYIAV
jgi:aryl-alcohol dehydrogenase-like predicted oxidoreductase